MAEDIDCFPWGGSVRILPFVTDAQKIRVPPVRIPLALCSMAGGLKLDDVPDTRDSLLIRVANPRDQSAWEQFARIYRPVVYNVARMRGLQDADAQDVAQQVLVAVARALPTWERRDESTLFRHWLCRIARNATLNVLTRQPKDRAVGGDAGRSAAEQQTGGELDSQIER